MISGACQGGLSKEWRALQLVKFTSLGSNVESAIGGSQGGTEDAIRQILKSAKTRRGKRARAAAKAATARGAAAAVVVMAVE